MLKMENSKICLLLKSRFERNAQIEMFAEGIKAIKILELLKIILQFEQVFDVTSE